MSLHRRTENVIHPYTKHVYRLRDVLVEENTDFDALPLSDAKNHLNLSHSQDDAYVRKLVVAASDYFERVTGHYLRKQKRRVTFDDVVRRYQIPAEPWQALESIEFFDEGTSQGGDVTNWYAQAGPPVDVMAKGNVGLPSGTTTEITYTVGYDKQEDIPGTIVQSLRVMVGDMYENRTPVPGQRIEEPPFSWGRLTAPFKTSTF